MLEEQQELAAEEVHKLVGQLEEAEHTLAPLVGEEVAKWEEPLLVEELAAVVPMLVEQQVASKLEALGVLERQVELALEEAESK